jgi:hypothetical protein
MEHRCGTRHKVDLEVDVRMGPQTLVGKGQLCELSLSGAFVATPLPLTWQPPITFALEVIFPDPYSLSDQSVQGHLVRRTDHGFAIEWNEFAPETVCRVLSRQQRSPKDLSRRAPPGD